NGGRGDKDVVAPRTHVVIRSDHTRYRGVLRRTLRPVEKKFFRLTSKGRSLWTRRKDLPLAAEYRRILGLVEYSGHRDVIRSYLGRFPRNLVDEWLTEFDAMRLIDAIASKEVSLADLSRKTAPPPLEPEDMGASSLEISFADISLSQLGVYVNHDRVANHP